MSSEDTLVIPRRTVDRPGGTLRVAIAPELNDYDQPMRWMLTWLAGEEEREIVAIGRGGSHVEARVPPGVDGYRLRRWTSDGIAPEYEDTLFEQR